MVADNRDLTYRATVESSALNGTTLLHSSTQAQGTLGKRVKKIAKAGGSGGLLHVFELTCNIGVYPHNLG